MPYQYTIDTSNYIQKNNNPHVSHIPIILGIYPHQLTCRFFILLRNIESFTHYHSLLVSFYLFKHTQRKPQGGENTSLLDPLVAA